MIYLLLSILASTLIFIIFKLFDRYGVDTQQAIVVNYVVACLSGLIFSNKSVDFTSIPENQWFYGAMGLGVIFILIFNLMAITTQKNGLSVAAVASKMSVAIPIVVGIILYKESTEFLKIAGIILGLVAVYLTAMKNSEGVSLDKKNLIFPILVFVGSGIIDTSIKYIETNYVAKDDVSIFSSTIFGFAAIIGIGTLIYKRIQSRLIISIRNILAGITLGVINFFSIYFLIYALRSDLMDSSTVFTINNIAILLVSTLAGIIIFTEKLMLKNWIGIILAMISIVMVASVISY